MNLSAGDLELSSLRVSKNALLILFSECILSPQGVSHKSITANTMELKVENSLKFTFRGHHDDKHRQKCHLFSSQFLQVNYSHYANVCWFSCFL